MLDIKKVDHIGIRISQREEAVAFYALLGFKLVDDAGFDQGHPIIMEHPSGVVVNLLGPSTQEVGTNILMDVAEKYSGITHVALRVGSLAETEALLSQKDIAITGRFSFGGLKAVFIRDPDRNVIELDERGMAEGKEDEDGLAGYRQHP